MWNPAATLLGLCLLGASVAAFGGSEDRFIKKYAMMKIYESCFGPEVVKQIRKEMRAACAKCAALETPPSPPPAPAADEQQQQHQQQPLPVAPGPAGYQPQSTLDIEKLHQAIMAYRPNPVPQPSFRPYGGPPAQSGFYGPLPYGNPGMSAGGYPLIYSGYQQVPFAPYGNFPIVGQPFFGNNRMSRDMDIKGQLEILTSKMSGRVRNITCVMQELGYLDENLEPNYVRISERIGNLPVNDELKKDMQDGVSFCQQFSQCVPEVKRDRSPLSRELIRPMFFFKCYKHKKLEACIMKDVREKYSGVTDEEFDNDLEIRRQGKSSKPDPEKEIDNLSSSMYEFLYASDSGFDIDGIL